VTLSVSNTDRVMLDRLQEIFGGGNVAALRGRQGNCRPAWQWRLRAGAAAAALERLTPYLVCKAGQAEVATASRVLIGKRGARNPHGRVLQALSDKLKHMKRNP